MLKSQDGFQLDKGKGSGGLECIFDFSDIAAHKTSTSLANPFEVIITEAVARGVPSVPATFHSSKMSPLAQCSTMTDMRPLIGQQHRSKRARRAVRALLSLYFPKTPSAISMHRSATRPAVLSTPYRRATPACQPRPGSSYHLCLFQ